MSRSTKKKQQQQDQGFSFRGTFTFGDDVFEEGFTASPNIFMNNYAKLGLSDAQAMFVLQILKFKWGKEDPYPSKETLACTMSASKITVSRYLSYFRERGFMFTKKPGPSDTHSTQSYNFTPLLYNAVRMNRWVAARKAPRDFELELPADIVAQVAYELYNDIPGYIWWLCDRHVKQGKEGTPLLLRKDDIEIARAAKPKAVNSSNEPKDTPPQNDGVGDTPPPHQNDRVGNIPTPPQNEGVQKEGPNNTHAFNKTQSAADAAAAADLENQALEFLTQISFTPSADAHRYAATHAQAIISWREALRTTEYAWVNNPAAFLRSQIDQNLTPPATSGEAEQTTTEQDVHDQAEQAVTDDGQADQATVSASQGQANLAAWEEKLRGVEGKTSKCRRTWTHFLAQMLEERHGEAPDKRQLGGVLKAVGGDLEAALALAARISSGATFAQLRDGDDADLSAPAQPKAQQDTQDLYRELVRQDQALASADRAVLQRLVTDAEDHRASLPPGSPGADVSGDGWVQAAIWQMVRQGDRVQAPLSYLGGIIDGWKRQGFKDQGRYQVPLAQSEPGQAMAQDDNGQRQARRIWDVALSELQLQINSVTFNTWIRPSQALEFQDGTLVVAVENPQVKAWLEGRLMDTVMRAASCAEDDGTDEVKEVRFEVREKI